VKIFFSVGEPSGDLHASNLIRRLHVHDPTLECVGFGGPKMEAAGCRLLFELTNMAVMFFAQAIANLRFFFGLIAQADQYFAQHPVDAVVLIDYSGFNWWIARKAKKHSIPVFYYGVPQVWAWAPWRIRKIRMYVDHVLCKLPFEKEWFAKRNCQAVYVGHPYFDQLHHQKYDPAFLEKLSEDDSPLVTLLPGSRTQEVSNNLMLLIDAASLIAKAVPQVRFAVASYDEKRHALAIETIRQAGKLVLQNGDRAEVDLGDGARIDLYFEKTPELMKSAMVCLACSGSVSLELLYHRKPTVIVYKISRLAMLLQSLFIRVRYITLVNLIAARDIRKTSWRAYDPEQPGLEVAIMPEYLTCGNPFEKVAAHAIKWLTDEAVRHAVINQLDDLAKAFTNYGASAKAADYIIAAVLAKGAEKVLKAASEKDLENRRIPA
jgi:lipid-A-disaccharide synthase